MYSNPKIPISRTEVGKIKRICLFAGYDKNNLIADYVLYYIKTLADFCDIYYMADCEMSQKTELCKLTPYTMEAHAYRHSKYDFGSWQELIAKIGWGKISQYDELILCNDSCFGPFFPLQPLFNKASFDNECDFWGMTEGFDKKNSRWFLQSYFLVFKHNVFTSNIFKEFIGNIKKENGKIDVVRNYEIALSKLLSDNGFCGKRLIAKGYRTQYDWRSLIEAGFPFLRIANFEEHLKKIRGESYYKFDSYLSVKTDYDISLIKKHLANKSISIKMFDFIYSLRYFLFISNSKLKKIFNSPKKNIKQPPQTIKVLGK